MAVSSTASSPEGCGERAGILHSGCELAEVFCVHSAVERGDSRGWGGGVAVRSAAVPARAVRDDEGRHTPLHTAVLPQLWVR